MPGFNDEMDRLRYKRLFNVFQRTPIIMLIAKQLLRSRRDSHRTVIYKELFKPARFEQFQFNKPEKPYTRLSLRIQCNTADCELSQTDVKIKFKEQEVCQNA